MKRNLQEQVLYLTNELNKIKQSLGTALPDPIEGPEGPEGPEGQRGEQGEQGFGIVGFGTQLPSSGRNGDWFLLKKSTMTGIDFVMCRCISQHWVEQFSIRGPAGPIANATEVVANPGDNASDNLHKVDIDGVIYQVSYVEKYNGVDNPYTFTGLEAVTINDTNYFVGGSWAKYLSASLYFDDENNKVVCEEDVKFKKDIYLTNNKTIYGGAGTDNEVEISGNYYLSGNVSLDDIQQFIDEDGNPIIVCENLLDKNHNYRFVEANGNALSQTGFTSLYCKWSLSGTHLMAVLAGTIEQNATITNGTILAEFTLPNYIKNKIVGIQANLLEYKEVKVVSSGYYTDIMNVYVDKNANGIIMVANGDYTSAYGGGFRIQMDLLIDMA